MIINPTGAEKSFKLPGIMTCYQLSWSFGSGVGAGTPRWADCGLSPWHFICIKLYLAVWLCSGSSNYFVSLRSTQKTWSRFKSSVVTHDIILTPPFTLDPWTPRDPPAQTVAQPKSAFITVILILYFTNWKMALIASLQGESLSRKDCSHLSLGSAFQTLQLFGFQTSSFWEAALCFVSVTNMQSFN